MRARRRIVDLWRAALRPCFYLTRNETLGLLLALTIFLIGLLARHWLLR